MVTPETPATNPPLEMAQTQTKTTIETTAMVAATTNSPTKTYSMATPEALAANPLLEMAQAQTKTSRTEDQMAHPPKCCTLTCRNPKPKLQIV